MTLEESDRISCREHFCHWCVTGYSWSNQIYVGSFLGPAGVIIGKVVNEGDYPRYTLSDL